MQQYVLYDANSAAPSYSCTFPYCSTKSLARHGTRRYDHPSNIGTEILLFQSVFFFLHIILTMQEIIAFWTKRAFQSNH